MNRLPAMFTTIEPRELRSDSAKHGAPTSGPQPPVSADKLPSPCIGIRTRRPLGGYVRTLIFTRICLCARIRRIRGSPPRARISDNRRRSARPVRIPGAFSHQLIALGQ